MPVAFSLSKEIPKAHHVVHLTAKGKKPLNASAELLKAHAEAVKNGVQLAHFSQSNAVQSVVHVADDVRSAVGREHIRNAGFKTLTWLNSASIGAVAVVNHTAKGEAVLLFAEGLSLGNYRYTALFSDQKSKTNALKKCALIDGSLSKPTLARFTSVIDAVCFTRDLVNHPLSHLNAEGLANAAKDQGQRHGFKVEVLNKKKIESLKMGGLLAVNRGSVDPPTFTIATYQPKNAVNAKPLVLVGKGVVFDTGGMSLKPTANSMDFMKSDMAGAAAVLGCISAAAAMKLPVYIIALIPATDNRVNGNAVVPGDVITMYDGTTVEVKNTDAEGRLLLADALAYAKKLNPELVFDAATLTGASVRAVGTYATSIMGTASQKVMNTIVKSGEDTYERVVPFPLWSEYADELRSTVADMSNLGKSEAGQISAGKFLEHFTDYPWVHFDIAGPSYLHAPVTYRVEGGTGVGVRLMVRFIEQYYNV